MITAISSSTDGVMRIRSLAREGRLVQVFEAATPQQRRVLRAATYEVAWPLVFQRITRPVERRRGHWRCAATLTRLADECVDGFHDDVEAVVQDCLRNARVEILNLEAWICRRLIPATVDGNRRRRGLRGALQRPRMPDWLAGELGHDPWLIRLALHVLGWVGVPDTAGAELWPIDSWVRARAEATGDLDAGPSVVRDDVERVLTAMRRRSAWYSAYVERPLGAKVPPPAPAGDAGREQRPVLPVTPDEEDDARLIELASVAVDAIAAGLDRGEDPRTVVARILRTTFGAGTGADELDRVPGGTSPAERALELVSDGGSVDRIADQVVRIITDRRIIAGRQ
ncbi:hypothetical protein [Actinoplanes sp. NPDC026623]|uniref:hypothetical protein n=1 Tax=Actinoplanes sp. NPDC026623 TaxID=3155610 RepID=UPI0034035A99